MCNLTSMTVQLPRSGMSAQSQHSAPTEGAPVPPVDAAGDEHESALAVHREVEVLPDGRRITYYSSGP